VATPAIPQAFLCCRIKFYDVPSTVAAGGTTAGDDNSTRPIEGAAVLSGEIVVASAATSETGQGKRLVRCSL